MCVILPASGTSSCEEDDWNAEDIPFGISGLAHPYMFL